MTNSTDRPNVPIAASDSCEPLSVDRVGIRGLGSRTSLEDGDALVERYEIATVLAVGGFHRAGSLDPSLVEPGL